MHSLTGCVENIFVFTLEIVTKTYCNVYYSTYHKQQFVNILFFIPLFFTFNNILIIFLYENVIHCISRIKTPK